MMPNRIHVIQGEYHVARGDAALSMTTVLGSCIAVSMFDPQARAGGMNHFLLAQGSGANAASASYGVNAMELLINGLLKLGAERSRLRAHVHGGARMIAGLSDVGAKNVDFARRFLRDEGIAIATQSTGGTSARRVTFWPADARVEEIMVRDRPVEKLVEPKAAQTQMVELF